MKFRFLESTAVSEGYEIHMGRTDSSRPVVTFEDGNTDGCFVDNKCFGTYVHGILDNLQVVEYLLEPYKNSRSGISEIDWKSYKQKQYDLLADFLREYLDIERIYKIIGRDD